MATGATALAEGGRRFKVDVDLAFNHLKATDRKFILRTVFDSLGVWKGKYAEVNISAKKKQPGNQNKEWAIIDGEVWVFRVDATNANDIVAAVQIAKAHYKIKAEVLLKDIYIKNLNAEFENEMLERALVSANKSLYKKTCEAIREAAKTFAIRGELNLHVFSNNLNPKIPRRQLHAALGEGGATSVTLDADRYQYEVSKNDNSQPKDQPPFYTHHHVAVFDL